MRSLSLVLLLILSLAGSSGLRAETDVERATVAAASFESVLSQGKNVDKVSIERFDLDRLPVTNAQFLQFVKDHPQWQRNRVPSVFADRDYLSHWATPAVLGKEALPDQPVTRISWFAARAYCESRGERLPTWNEWEWAAAADERRLDARKDPVWQERILSWYAEPAGRPLRRVGVGPANIHGIRDLHGLVWEWVEDFNALLVSADSREQGDPDRLRFCGAGALSLADRDSYALLMRVAFLSSLEGNSTARALGFRCAQDAS